MLSIFFFESFENVSEKVIHWVLVIYYNIIFNDSIFVSKLLFELLLEELIILIVFLVHGGILKLTGFAHYSVDRIKSKTYV